MAQKTDYEFINYLLTNKYFIYNVNDKLPNLGTGDEGWSKIKYDDTFKYINYKSDRWGMRTGWQPNEKYIIGLDFDMWYKSGNDYVSCHNTEKLFNEFKNLNSDLKGVYSSSTYKNMGCLVDITKSKKLIDALSNDGRRKLQKKNFCLELCNCWNLVLPPTKTVCKINKTSHLARTFLSQDYFLIIEENSELENFIFNYINDCKKNNKIPKENLRSLTNKKLLIEYEENVGKNKVLSKNQDILKLFIDNIDVERIKNYSEWMKLGFCIKNTLGDEGLQLFKYLSMLDINNYNENDVEYYFNIWDINKYKYQSLNVNYLLNCVKKDNPEKFLYCLLKLKEIEQESEYNEKKERFEKECRKVLEQTIYLSKSRKTGEWDYIDENDLHHRYLERYGKNFIKQYIDDENKNYYDIMDFIPDVYYKEEEDENENKLKIFNLFKGFYITNHKVKDENKKDIAEKLIKEHIQYMTNFDEKAYIFVVQWISNLLFNSLKKSKTCLIIRGDEGTGKGSFYNIISKMIGNKYSGITSKAETDIFSKFNSFLTNKLIVNINEAEYNTFNKNMENFKSLITDDRLTIEAKNKNVIELNDYCRYIITTNNTHLFQAKNSERRFYFIETSDKLVNNKSYFDNFYNLLNDDDIIYYIYKWFECQLNKNYDFENEVRNNKTDFQKVIESNSIPTFYEFLQDFIENNDNEEIIIKPKELFDNYKRFCNQNTYNINENGKSIKLKLTLIDMNVYKKVSNINNYVIKKSVFVNYMKSKKYWSE